MKELKYKICAECKIKRKIDCFSLRPKNKYGKVYRNGYCNKCMSLRAMKWSKDNKVKFQNYQNKYKHDKSKN